MTVFDQRMAEAERLLQQGQPEQAKKLFKQLAGQPDLDAIQRGRSCYALGTALYTLHEFQEGCAALDKAWQVFSAELGAEHPATTRVLILLARCHVAMDDMDTGNRLGRQVLAILRRTSKPDDPQLAAACFFLSSGVYQVGLLDEAESLTREAMAIWEHLFGHRSVEVSTCLNNLGRIEEERGHLEKGIALHKEAVSIRKELLGNHRETAFSLGNLGTALATAGRWQEAADTLKEALDCYAAAGVTSGFEIEGYRANLALCHKALADCSRPENL